MTRRVVRMRSPSAAVIAVYLRRGMEPPLLCGPVPEAALWSYLPRFTHELYAQSHGYFWLPCVLCGREFGGHEITDSIPDPTSPDRLWTHICPACTAERNGGEP